MDLNAALVNNLADFQSFQIPPILFSATYVGRKERILLHYWLSEMRNLFKSVFLDVCILSWGSRCQDKEQFK